MNIFTTVIDSLATGGVDVTTSGGYVNITGLSKSIPQRGVVYGKRLLAGEFLHKYTVTVATATGGAYYTISVLAADPVSGAQKNYSVTYKALASGDTTTTIATALAAQLSQQGNAPFTATASTTTVVIQMLTGTPSAQISVTPTLLTFAETTTKLGSATTVVINGSGALSGATSAFAGTTADLGILLEAKDSTSGVTTWRGFVSVESSTSACTVIPVPATALTGQTIYQVTNTGTYFEAMSSWKNLVALTAGNLYVVYEINATDIVPAGNGARPDMIQNKYLIFVNAGDADGVWGSGDFDSALATALGVTF